MATNNNMSSQTTTWPVNSGAILAAALQEVSRGNVGLAMNLVANGLFPEIGAVVAKKIVDAVDARRNVQEAANKIGELAQRIRNKLSGVSAANVGNVLRELQGLQDDMAAVLGAAAVLVSASPALENSNALKSVEVAAAQIEQQFVGLKDKNTLADNGNQSAYAPALVAPLLVKPVLDVVPSNAVDPLSNAFAFSQYATDLTNSSSPSVTSVEVKLPQTVTEIIARDKQIEDANKRLGITYSYVDGSKSAASEAIPVSYSQARMLENFSSSADQMTPPSVKAIALSSTADQISAPSFKAITFPTSVDSKDLALNNSIQFSDNLGNTYNGVPSGPPFSVPNNKLVLANG